MPPHEKALLKTPHFSTSKLIQALPLLLHCPFLHFYSALAAQLSMVPLASCSAEGQWRPGARGRGRDPPSEAFVLRGADQLSLSSCCLLTRLLRDRLKLQRSNGKDSGAPGSQAGRLLRGPPAGGILQMRQRTVLLGGRAEDTFLWPVLWNDWGQRWEREDVNLTSPYAWEGDITCPLSAKSPCSLQKADGRWLTAFS